MEFQINDDALNAIKTMMEEENIQTLRIDYGENT